MALKDRLQGRQASAALAAMPGGTVDSLNEKQLQVIASSNRVGMLMSKIACVAIVKNEERHISEWIAYQFACGFDTIILFDNLSTDRTKDKANLIARNWDVRVLGWDMLTPDYQLSAYEHAFRIFGNEFSWMAFFDTDEFLVLSNDLDLHNVLEASSDTAAAIAIPWSIFGSNGHRERPEGLIISSFVRRSETTFGPNRHVKSIVRPETVISCINPHAFNVEGKYIDLEGAEITWESPGILKYLPNYDAGKLNHYFTRSWENWLGKICRGYPDLERKLNEFEVYDRNEVFDNSAIKHEPNVKVMITQFQELFNRN